MQLALGARLDAIAYAAGKPTQPSSAAATATLTLTPTRTATVPATATPTATRTSTAAPTSTSTATRTATSTPTPQATNSPTATQTNTSAPTVTSTSTAGPTSTSTLTSTATKTNTPTATGTITATVTITPTSTGTVTITPTGTATSTPSTTPTVTETTTPVGTPTMTPTPGPGTLNWPSRVSPWSIDLAASPWALNPWSLGTSYSLLSSVNSGGPSAPTVAVARATQTALAVTQRVPTPRSVAGVYPTLPPGVNNSLNAAGLYGNRQFGPPTLLDGTDPSEFSQSWGALPEDAAGSLTSQVTSQVNEFIGKTTGQDTSYYAHRLGSAAVILSSLLFLGSGVLGTAALILFLRIHLR